MTPPSENEQFDEWLQATPAGKTVALIMQGLEENPEQLETALWCVVGQADGREIRNRAFALLKLPEWFRQTAEMN